MIVSVNVHQSPVGTMDNGGDPRLSQADPDERSEAFDLAPRSASAAEARHRTRAWLFRHSVEQGAAETAVLVISELVTNAVVHSGSGVIGCTLRLGPGFLNVEVTDQGDGEREPAVREPAVDDVSGRGLLLVSTLAKAWGVTPAVTGGRTVWATLPTTE
jgi:anti-sigma regulatory factor (Ser/Thr protein kinase)